MPHGDAEVARQVRAGGEREDDVAGRRVEPGGDEHDGADVRESEQRPRRGVPRRAAPASGGDLVVPRAPCGAAPVGDDVGGAVDPDLLAGAGGRAEVEQVAGQPHARRRVLLGATLGRGPPRRHPHRRHGEHTEQHERRVDRAEQHQRDDEPSDRADRAHQRAVDVIEEEHLLAEELQAIEIRRSLVVLDAGNRRLEMGDVGLDFDRRPVAEPHLDAAADRAQQPARGRGRARGRTRPRPPCSGRCRARRRRAA